MVSTGGVLNTVLDAHDILENEGIFFPVHSLPWLKPICSNFVSPLHRYRKIIAVEEHVVEGGLAGLLRENLPSGSEVHSVFVPERTADYVGSQDYLRTLSGLSEHELVVLCRNMVGAR